MHPAILSSIDTQSNTAQQHVDGLATVKENTRDCTVGNVVVLRLDVEKAAR